MAPDSLPDRYIEPAPRPVRRRWGLVVMTLIVVVTAWAAARHFASGGLKDAEIEAGVVELRRAIAVGEPEAFDRAEAHFVDAASVSVTDAYPAFLLHTNRRLRAGSGTGTGAKDAQVLAAVARRDFEAARTAAAALGPEDSKPRVYWERLLAELSTD